MKKIALLFIAVILVFSVSSCKKEKSDTPDGMFYEENTAVDYKLYLPEGWIIDRNDGMVSAHVSEEDKTNVSVTAFELPREFTTLTEYLDGEYKTRFQQNFTSMEIVEDFTETELDGNDARRIVFKAEVGGVGYQFMQILTLHRDGCIYILTYTSTPDYFDVHKESIDKIVQEFTFN
ncbi:MAG: hypothetical protein IKV53_06210 [Clostridia bacterium]|jgi:hypothetical protein|nr:hypothetical protein [Clostridia bacterium]